MLAIVALAELYQAENGVVRLLPISLMLDYPHLIIGALETPLSAVKQGGEGWDCLA